MKAEAFSLATPAADDRPHVDQPGRSAGLFREPRVGVGVLLGRMGMGLLFGGLASAAGGVMMMAAAFAALPTGVLVAGVILTGALIGLATAVGASMFGTDYGRDFVDALVVSMVAAAVGGLLFVVGFFMPMLLVPMLAVGVGVTVIGVPFFVQAFKRSDAPEATVALLQF